MPDLHAILLRPMGQVRDHQRASEQQPAPTQRRHPREVSLDPVPIRSHDPWFAAVAAAVLCLRSLPPPTEGTAGAIVTQRRKDLVNHTSRRIAILFAAAAVLALAMSASAGAAGLKPFGHDCTAQNGVRFCPTADPAGRVPTFDGVPLDADVTLPAKGKGPFPVIVMMHGWGGSKTNFEATDPQSGNGYNNLAFAKRGYAVLTYSARGFGGSCGGGPSGDHAGDCGQGYIHLSDSRYEARDTQFLLGLLADEKVVKPNRIGVTGISYGGIQSVELAFLHNKIRKPSGKLAPWRSPDGLHMSVTAAYPRWPGSDLVNALIPNGHFLDTEVAAKGESLDPPGAPIQSYVTGLFALGSATGYYYRGAPASTPCTDDDSNITRNFGFLTAGDFVTPDAQTAFHETYADKAGYPLRFLKGHSKPSPLLIENGFTDDLFPPEHAMRVYNYVRSLNRNFPVSLQFGDLGHSRGANEDNVNDLFTKQGVKFFGHWLKGVGRAPASGSVTTFDETCPNGGDDAGPYKSKSWPASHKKSFAFGSQAAQTFNAMGGNPTVAGAFDPIGGTSDSCKTIAVTPESNTATYTKNVKKPVHMMGMTTISAHISATGETSASPGEIVGRLWDIDSDAGTQRLIDRGVYTFTKSPGNVTFQLHGNGYTFAKGHKIQLELLGADAPYFRPANGAFSVTVSKLTADLPLLTGSG